MRATFLLVALALVPAFATAAQPSRFSGSGSLVQGASESADGRFALKAELEQGDRSQQSGRFSLTARLEAADLAKSAMAACTFVLFKDGFE